jgi:hypothetical protein
MQHVGEILVGNPEGKEPLCLFHDAVNLSHCIPSNCMMMGG